MDNIEQHYTKEQQELVTQQLNQDDLLKQIPTLDSQVRDVLIQLNQPEEIKTGNDKDESNADRRDRLIQLIVSSEDMKVKFVELMTESGDQDMEDYNEDEDDGEFYTPGPTNLYDIRKSISEYSLSRARLRIAKQRQLFNEVNTRNIDFETGESLTEDRFTQILQTRRNFNDKYLKKLKLQGSQIVSGRFTSMVRISPHVSDEEGRKERIIACGSWDGKTYLMDSQLNNFAVLKGHTDKVSGLDWNPQKSNNSENMEEQQVATGGGEGSINIYNIPSSPSKFSPPKNENGTTVVSPTHNLQHSSQSAANSARTARIKYHQSGKFLASAHYDNTWKLWDLTKLVPSSSSPPLLYEQEDQA
ncbi:unnamed protein product [Ambrosiozyma monospora]|uniref:Unnamed protein product n=1 Tax=Ambrosiozyma monospora TaxID=43982 RepID=A0A9W6Z3T9_AMBMO|nr:unnamed protein product [Ambrosiozyma monospora]